MREVGVLNEERDQLNQAGVFELNQDMKENDVKHQPIYGSSTPLLGEFGSYKDKE